MPVRLLVTGGLGFIGSHFVRDHLARGRDEIVVLDKVTYAGNPANLADVRGDPRLRIVRGDVCDRAVVDRLMRRADAVVHFAAETHVDRSIHDAGVFVQTDVFGTFVLLDAARRHAISRFVHISTDEVYGEAADRPTRETDPLMPKSPYAASKVGADRLAFAYHATYGLPVVIARCTNNYGPYQHPEKLIPRFTTNALRDRPMPVYGTGRWTREWIHVRDHVEALEALLAADGLEGETFNIGTGEELGALDVARRILGILGKRRSLIQHVEDRPGAVRRHAVDSSKIRKRLGWRPRTDFARGLEETVDWYGRSRAWWGPTVRRMEASSRGDRARPGRSRGRAKRR